LDVETHYSQIDLAERRQIQQMRDTKVPIAVTVARLGRHRSTIRREMTPEAGSAPGSAGARDRQAPGGPVRSPQQIAGRLKREPLPAGTVSH